MSLWKRSSIGIIFQRTLKKPTRFTNEKQIPSCSWLMGRGISIIVSYCGPILSNMNTGGNRKANLVQEPFLPVRCQSSTGTTITCPLLLLHCINIDMSVKFMCRYWLAQNSINWKSMPRGGLGSQPILPWPPFF